MQLAKERAMRFLTERDALEVKEIDKLSKCKWSWKWLQVKVQLQTVKGLKEFSLDSFFQKVDIPGKARCRLCAKNISYESKGYGALQTHARGSSHVRLVSLELCKQRIRGLFEGDKHGSYGPSRSEAGPSTSTAGLSASSVHHPVPVLDRDSSDEFSPSSMESQPASMASLQAVQQEGLPVIFGPGKFKWNHDSTMLLIEEYGRHKDKFDSSSLKKGAVWDLIARRLQERGYQCSGENCWKKWRNLKDNYKKIRCHHEMMGTGRIKWAYYNHLDEQLYHDPSCQPTMAIRTPPEVVYHTSTNRPRARSTFPPPEEPHPSSSSSSFEPEWEREVPQYARRYRPDLQHYEEPVAAPLSRSRFSRKRKLNDPEKGSMKETNDLLVRVAVAIEEKNKILKERNELLRELMTERNALFRKMAEKK